MITLRPHQDAAVKAVQAAFVEGVRRPLVNACVGAGKSLIFAKLAQLEMEQGGRVIIGAHTRELVEQNAEACRKLGLPVAINAAGLNERTWRAPIISAAIQSVYSKANAFGPISLLCGDEAHLWPHSQSGMYRQLHRDLDFPRLVGGSGTVFRLQGGSLIEGDDAPFDKVVFSYSILDGIRDGYLVPAFSVPADDKIDATRLRVSNGEFTGESQDDHMISAMDNHIAQMLHYGRDRRLWLVFEASEKAARAMTARMREWGIPTGLVLGKTPGVERESAIKAARDGRLRALVNISALTTGFDVPQIDMLVMRRRTKSLGLYIQMTGRVLRTIGGNIEASILAGKPDALVQDFAGNIDLHGPLDCILPKETKAGLVACDACGTRNARASLHCWKCGETLTKNCPLCLQPIPKQLLDCPHCGHDMRMGEREEKKDLLSRPTGAAIISAYSKGTDRVGGWIVVRNAWESDAYGTVLELADQRQAVFPVSGSYVRGVKWARFDDSGHVDAVLVPNGASRTSIRQVNAQGASLIVPLPPAV